MRLQLRFLCPFLIDSHTYTASAHISINRICFPHFHHVTPCPISSFTASRSQTHIPPTSHVTNTKMDSNLCYASNLGKENSNSNRLSTWNVRLAPSSPYPQTSLSPNLSNLMTHQRQGHSPPPRPRRLRHLRERYPRQ